MPPPDVVTEVCVRPDEPCYLSTQCARVTGMVHKFELAINGHISFLKEGIYNSMDVYQNEKVCSKYLTFRCVK